MQHFYVWRLDRKRRILLVASLLVMSLFILLAKNVIDHFIHQNKPAVLLRGDTEQNSIALTFNISWGEKKVDEVISVLKENDVQATFFVSGEWAERHPDFIKKIKDNNHELGMLGYRYKSYLDQEIEQVRKDLVYAREVFRKLGFNDIRLLRTPSGHFNKDVIDLAKQLNFEIVHWSVNPNDWESPGVDAIINTTLKETKSGDIILMHASDSAKQTAEALKVILPSLKNKSFEFVSISELINQASAETELVDE